MSHSTDDGKQKLDCGLQTVPRDLQRNVKRKDRNECSDYTLPLPIRIGHRVYEFAVMGLGLNIGSYKGVLPPNGPLCIDNGDFQICTPT